MNKIFWKNKSVLVTGGTGLLGSEMVSQLVNYGANVSLIIRDEVPRSRLHLDGLINKVQISKGDIIDYEFVERVVGENEIDTIFHLAAQTIVGIANQSPISTFNTNIKGTWNVLEAARHHMPKIKAVIVASSDKAYGQSDILPYNEEVPLQGRHPYDVSKSCADLISQSYWHSYELPVSVTRCGNLFGPGDLNFNRLIPGTILSVLNGEAPIIRSDGKFVRNYFYTKDAVNGYLTIAENIQRTKGQTFNLGTDERFSVLEMLNLILKLMDSKIKPIIKNEASNEIRDQYLAVEKAKEVLGWSTTYKVKKALKETIDWYKRYDKITKRKNS